MISDKEINRIADLVTEKILAESCRMDRWLTVQQAKRYAKMSRNTLMDCIFDGLILGTKRKKGGWVVDRESIDEYNRNKNEDLLLNDIVKRLGVSGGVKMSYKWRFKNASTA